MSDEVSTLVSEVKERLIHKLFGEESDTDRMNASMANIAPDLNQAIIDHQGKPHRNRLFTQTKTNELIPNTGGEPTYSYENSLESSYILSSPSRPQRLHNPYLQSPHTQIDYLLAQPQAENIFLPVHPFQNVYLDSYGFEDAMAGQLWTSSDSLPQSYFPENHQVRDTSPSSVECLRCVP